jgi:uncharacterized membrane protein YphA (DoxX/SURF4 family)
VVPGSGSVSPRSTEIIRLVRWIWLSGYNEFTHLGSRIALDHCVFGHHNRVLCPAVLVFGFLTRIAAFGIGAEFIGVALKAHINNGFFMNWYKQPNKREGLEFFTLLFGLVIICLVLGGGRGSIDATISQRRNA